MCVTLVLVDVSPATKAVVKAFLRIDKKRWGFFTMKWTAAFKLVARALKFDVFTDNFDNISIGDDLLNDMVGHGDYLVVAQ